MPNHAEPAGRPRRRHVAKLGGSQRDGRCQTLTVTVKSMAVTMYSFSWAVLDFLASKIKVAGHGQPDCHGGTVAVAAAQAAPSLQRFHRDGGP